MTSVRDFNQEVIPTSGEYFPAIDTQNYEQPKVSKAKSTSSFLIAPNRSSTTVLPSTGKLIDLKYSYWNTQPLSDVIQCPNPLNSRVQSHSTYQLFSWKMKLNIWLNHIKFYIKSLFTFKTLKASFTYFIASLFVYLPFFSSLLGSTDSKHIVCTVVVYFHSARSVGSMIQSLIFVAISLFFGIGVSVSTMKLISLYLNSEIENIDGPLLNLNAAQLVQATWKHPHKLIAVLIADRETISIIITLLTCSTALGFVSFCKHRVSKPTFNTSCSLCAILMISCLIKESSKMYTDPSNDNNIVLPWAKVTSSISCILLGCMVSVVICFTLLKEWAQNSLIDGLDQVEISVGSTLGLLCELFVSGDNETDTDSLEKIQLINQSKEKLGVVFTDLKSKLALLDGKLEETLYECYALGREKEYSLLKDLVECERKLVVNLSSLRRAVNFKWEILEGYELEKLQTSESNQVHDQTIHDLSPYVESTSSSYLLEDSTELSSEFSHGKVIEPKELFDLFFYHIGPSTKSFVFTMKEILKDKMFIHRHTIKTTVRQYSKSLDLAKELFDQHQSKAINSLYKQEIFTTERTFNGKVSQEEIAATCANYSFSLVQFSNELSMFLVSLNCLLEYYEANSPRSFEFLKMWKWKSIFRPSTPLEVIDLERGDLIGSDACSDDTISYRIWKITKFIRRIDFQFGLRVGLGALIIGSFAFLPSTRHTFNEWRGEWVLVTFCIIMNKSLGGTAMTVKWRFLGTLVGALTAYWSWICFYPNMIIMALFGWLVSIPCFSIILTWKKNNAFGRFILLTYNLTVLYSYTMSLNDPSVPDMPDDWEGGQNPIIFEVAFHRYIGVSVGVIWALIITMTLFPISARSRIRHGLTILWLRMGLLWKKGPLVPKINEFGTPTLFGLHGLNGCHKIQSELRVLLSHAPMELRLKGPFPVETYQKLINYTENIMDAFENMNAIIDIDPYLSPVEDQVLNELQAEMKELENRVFLMFYMLSSALRLKLGLMVRAAGVDSAMEKLVFKLSKLRNEAVKGKGSDLSNEDFVLFYTYCLVTEAIVADVGRMVNEVVGLYNQPDEDLIELI
ncbi:hypothetical protein DAMA08_039240 [Martiniozyma asiatica (nom. inval.)]|nr:hypothetical protein DAMA08_039240 [Martiniozyma asiatica]